MREEETRARTWGHEELLRFKPGRAGRLPRVAGKGSSYCRDGCIQTCLTADLVPCQQKIVTTY